MQLNGISAVVTGGAGGLGFATARRLVKAGAHVVLADLPTSAGERLADELGSQARFVAADINSDQDMEAAMDAAEQSGPLRAIVHTPGRGLPKRIVDNNGNPFPMADFRQVVELNLFGTFNVLRLSAARMAKNEEVGGDRGAVVMTASVAAFEGQVGQAAYTASKAAVAGLTLCAARDLSSHRIRVNTIAPGIFETPLLARLPQKVKDNLGASVPHPARLGDPDEYAALAESLLTNSYLNGEVIRLDGAIRMAPR
ncbi:SDR family NAD(P)-dependent oxidoreductase [Streptomyces sp. NPDC056938]|uniref:SDR family NAD(P)-dependent oxidoreductase n=1 Tax=unclassified Streptomyces TaxID=2593676 RepID=UPI00362DD8D2